MIIFIPCLASAGLLIEPYVGFGLGTSAETKLTTPAYNFEVETDAGSGIGFGGRLGYSFAGLFAAVDYSIESFSKLSPSI